MPGKYFKGRGGDFARHFSLCEIFSILCAIHTVPHVISNPVKWCLSIVKYYTLFDESAYQSCHCCHYFLCSGKTRSYNTNLENYTRYGKKTNYKVLEQYRLNYGKAPCACYTACFYFISNQC